MGLEIHTRKNGWYTFPIGGCPMRGCPTGGWLIRGYLMGGYLTGLIGNKSSNKLLG